MRQIFLMTGLSMALFASFTRSGNIVTDNTTGLQWQDDTTPATMTWTQAIDYCEALTLGGQSDWRVPNFNELYFLSDRSKSNPAIDSTFQNVVSSLYWSSSTMVGSESNAWYVYFSGGNGHWGGKSFSYFVRCVRDGQ